MIRRLQASRAAALAALLLSLTTGCQPAMSTQPDKPQGEATSSMFPLKFYKHSFDVFCYNTLRCHVIYDNRNLTPYKADDRPSGPPTSPDGTEHEAKVDIGAIFKDQRVLYRVPDSEIPDKSWGDDPSIHLEINDRTINVYMRAYIVTKTEQIPGNPHSYHRTDTILAWTRTY